MTDFQNKLSATPVVDELKALREAIWFNDGVKPAREGLLRVGLTQADVEDAQARLRRFAPLIAAASGPLGTNAQYLFSLEQELVKLGMQDDCLNDLVITVKRLLGENLPEGVMRPGFA